MYSTCSRPNDIDARARDSFSSLLSVVLAPRPDTCGRLQKEKKESCCSVQYVHIHIAFGAHARRIYGAHSSFCSRREKEKRRVLKILSRFFASRYIVVPHHRTASTGFLVTHKEKAGESRETKKGAQQARQQARGTHAPTTNRQPGTHAEGAVCADEKKERNNENTTPYIVYHHFCPRVVKKGHGRGRRSAAGGRRFAAQRARW